MWHDLPEPDYDYSKRNDYPSMTDKQLANWLRREEKRERWARLPFWLQALVVGGTMVGVIVVLGAFVIGLMLAAG